MRRAAYVIALGLLLSACGVYRVDSASIDRVELEVMPGASAVKVVAHGVLGNGCTRVGNVEQRREGETFFITIETIYEQPAGMGCTLAVSEFQEEVVLDVIGFDGGNYTVNVNGVTAAFSLPFEEHEMVAAVIEHVDVVVLESYPAQVEVYVVGYYGGCTTLSSVSQRREENSFFITVLVSAPIAFNVPTCPPVEVPFDKQVRLDAGLEPGTYTVDVNGTVERFQLP